jgi:hypothetical protein
VKWWLVKKIFTPKNSSASPVMFYTKTMRLLNLEALGGMVDIDLETIHIFDANITFDSMKEIDGNAFESIMIPFFNNPVDDISEEQLVREIYEQYNR